MYQNFVPKFPGRYLSSNVNITIAGPDGSPVSVPVGSQFTTFVMNAVTFLIVSLVHRSLRQVQDTKVSYTPPALTMFFNFACTCRGRTVTSVGVLYDFTGNDHNTTVQKVEDMVKEAWVS